MNCLECQQLLQERLDGQRLADGAVLEKHLATCSDCRGLHAAAGRLLDGLRHLKAPVAPADLQARIVSDVLADRDSRLVFRRRMVAVLALAAGLLLAVATVFPLLNQQKVHVSPVASTPTTPKLPANPVMARKPSLRGSFTQAGAAFASLTRRTAGETVGQTRLLIPETVPAPLPVPNQVETPMQSVSQGVSAGFEPLTTSARRAFGMLLADNSDEKQ